jgi:hypothetical protein
MAYTFAWNYDPVPTPEVKLFSAHNPMIFDYLFNVAAPSTEPTDPNSSVDVVVKNAAGTTIYSNTFAAYLYSATGAGPWVYNFILDFSEIIRHVITSMLFKAISGTFNLVDLISLIEFDIDFFDGAAELDDEQASWTFGHGVKQIGANDGSALSELYLKRDDILTYFLGLPMFAFFYSHTDISAKTPRYTFTNKAGGTITASGGTLGKYMHAFKVHSALTVDKNYILLTLDCTDATALKIFHLTVIKVCELNQKQGLYIRFLDENGGYTYWFFERYYTRQIEGSHIGTMPKNFSMMRSEQIRNYNLGYNDSFEKLIGISAGVPFDFRRKLQNLFVSPCVYVWLGADQYGYELCQGYVNDTDNPYDTFTAPGAGIANAVTDGSALARCFATEVLRIRKNELFNFIGTLTLDSGAAPYIGIHDPDLGFISDVQILSNGANDKDLTCFMDSDNARLCLYNATASQFHLASIDHVKKENEELWVLCDHVEGSHDLLTKKGADNFSCTFVLPKRYTQLFSRTLTSLILLTVRFHGQIHFRFQRMVMKRYSSLHQSIMPRLILLIILMTLI